MNLIGLKVFICGEPYFQHFIHYVQLSESFYQCQTAMVMRIDFGIGAELRSISLDASYDGMLLTLYCFRLH